jgi:hypothetical protein
LQPDQLRADDGDDAAMSGVDLRTVMELIGHA